MNREDSGGLRPRRLLFVLPLLAGVAVLLSLAVAESSHFRYMHSFWAPSGGNTIEFSVQQAWRRSAFNCINPATLGGMACSPGDGDPQVGDYVSWEGQLCFGDSMCAPSSLARVTSVDPPNDWMFVQALDPASWPTIDTTLAHTYAAPGNYTSFTSSCCRIGQTIPNHHVNNPDAPWMVSSLVNVGTGNRSPLTGLPPIVFCPINDVCGFTIPAADPDGDPITFRFATPTEVGDAGFDQPGPPQATNAATIDPNTGLYSWDTNGATLAPAGRNTLYSTQVIMEDRDGAGAVKSRTAVDFFIQLVTCPVGGCQPPVFDVGPTPACGSTLNVGGNISFTVQASDPNAQDQVTLNVGGLPVGATMTPGLPTMGNPVSSVFDWSPGPGQEGTYVVTFIASSQDGGALCSITLEVGAGQLDHFKCYYARALGGVTAGLPTEVFLEDQFIAKSATVVTPWLHCNPVDKNGEGISNADDHLVCYTISEASGEPIFRAQTVEIDNQFGSLRIAARKPSFLCVPSAKNEGNEEEGPAQRSFSIDHFKCYDSRPLQAFNRLLVRLEDQFEITNAFVIWPLYLCNPVDKNEEGISRPDDHLVCYFIANVPGYNKFTPRRLEIDNQFGENQNLVVWQPLLLCVPSTKQGTEPPGR